MRGHGRRSQFEFAFMRLAKRKVRGGSRLADRQAGRLAGRQIISKGAGEGWRGVGGV